MKNKFSFTDWAKSKNMSVVDAAKDLMNNPKKYNIDISLFEKNKNSFFSPEEVEKIERELGDDVLDKLAPNSAANEDKLEGENPKMATGGRLSAEKARIMLHDGTIHGKPITEQQRKYFGWVASGRKGYADGGGVDGFDPNEEAKRIKAEKEKKAQLEKDFKKNIELYQSNTEKEQKASQLAKRLESAKALREAKVKEYQDFINNPANKNSAFFDIERGKKLNEIQQLDNQINSGSKKIVAPKTAITPTDYVTKKNVPQLRLSANEIDNSITPIEATKQASAPQAAVKPSAQVIAPKLGLAATTAPKPSYATFNPNEYAAREDANLTAPTADANQMAKAESSALAPPPTAPVQGEMGIAEGAGTLPPPSAKADLGKALTSGLSTLTQYGVPLAQTAIGLSYLNKAGKRPIDKIDPDYLQGIGTARGIVDRANTQAKYGFSPEEMAMINQQNQAETNAQRFAARNLSGGSAANALTNERSAINDSFTRGLAAKTQNRNLQLAKQQYADTKQSELNSLLADKANRSRMLFGDTLNAWQQSQAAGAGLVGAGLANLTSADRYRQELEAARLRNEKYGN